jgi:hypothetical protein
MGFVELHDLGQAFAFAVALSPLRASPSPVPLPRERFGPRVDSGRPTTDPAGRPDETNSEHPFDPPGERERVSLHVSEESPFTCLSTNKIMQHMPGLFRFFRGTETFS